MGVGLTLYPIIDGIKPEAGIIYTRDRLSFVTGDWSIIDQFKRGGGRWKIKTSPLPKQVLVQPPEGFPTGKDNYGEPLSFVTAGELRGKIKLPKGTFATHRALMAYVSKLPAKTPIILFFT